MRISDEQVAYLEKLYSSDENYEEWKKHYDGRRGSQISDILADLREARAEAARDEFKIEITRKQTMIASRWGLFLSLLVLLVGSICGAQVMRDIERRLPCNADHENALRAGEGDDIERCTCTDIGRTSEWICEWKDAFR